MSADDQTASPGSLPPFPVDDATLDAVEHALDYYLEADPDAPADSDFPFRGAGADYPLHRLLDFTAGTLDQDDPRVEHLPPEQWIDGIPTTVDHRASYTERDVIAALIGEVRRLRATQTTQTGPVDQAAVEAHRARLLEDLRGDHDPGSGDYSARTFLARLNDLRRDFALYARLHQDPSPGTTTDWQVAEALLAAAVRTCDDVECSPAQTAVAAYHQIHPFLHPTPED